MPHSSHKKQLWSPGLPTQNASSVSVSSTYRDLGFSKGKARFGALGVKVWCGFDIPDEVISTRGASKTRTIHNFLKPMETPARFGVSRTFTRCPDGP